MRINQKTQIKYSVVGLLLMICIVTSSVFLCPVQGQTGQIDIRDFIYSTFLGGSHEDHTKDLVTDSQGNIIVAGQTLSPNFPIKDAYQDTFAGGLDDPHGVGGDAIVAKFDQNGQLLWSTFLGGSNKDGAECVRVDDTDNIYVFGMTDSVDFPITPDAYQQGFLGGNYDLFITKFAPNGSLVYSSYLGTANDDGFGDCQIDSNGDLVLAGITTSADFPVTIDATQTVFGGGADGFLIRLSANCSSIMYSTFLGGSGSDGIDEIAIDNQGNIVTTGYTLSLDFPITANAFQNTITGTYRDFFIAKYDTSNQLIYSTFFGGSHMDDCFGITTDSSGNIIFSGRTWSADFPVANAYQENYSNIQVDGLVSKLSPNGQELTFSSYFGGSGWDTVHHVDVDSTDNIVASGIGGPDGFPILKAFQEHHRGAVDMILMLISPEGQPLFCSYLGSSGSEHPWDQYLSDDYLFIVGYTSSPNFLISNSAYQQTYGGDSDGFIFRFNITGYLAAIELISTESTSTTTITESINTPGFEYVFIVLGVLLIISLRMRKKGKKTC
ncbi:MAG: hypothetical protein ACFFBD_07485 [Candidatus Hodarchaeota archaeon]